MKDILLSLCTRERPAKAKGFVEKWRETTNGRSRLVIAMESDDKTVGSYHIPNDALYVSGLFGSQGAAINAVLKAHPDYAYYGFLSDDHRLNTPGWEDMVSDKLKFGGVAYGDDGFQGINLPTSAFFHGDTLRAVGYVAPPGMRHMYIDNVWGDLGRGIDRLYYMPDLSVEHVHPAAGKAEWDEQYLRVNNDESYARDLGVYEEWKANELPQAIQRMRTALGE